MEKPEIRIIAIRKRLNRCLPKLARVTNVPEIYASTKFHYDPIRKFYPGICEVTCQMFMFWVLPTGYPLQSCRPILSINRAYVERRFAQGYVPCGGFRKRNFTSCILTPFPQKKRNIRSIFDGTSKRA